MNAQKPVQARFSINLLENSDGEILLLKRSPSSKLGPNTWGFPAGHIEPGETPEQCAQRELFEEIGSSHQASIKGSLGPIRDKHYGGIYEIYLFHLSWQHGEIILNNEHTDYVWVDKHEYKKYPVMDGIDQDLYLLNIWPIEFLNQDKIIRT